MFSKKNVLFILGVGFFAVVFVGSGFAEKVEPEPAVQTDTGIIEESPDEKVKVIPASYQPVELVREFGAKFCDRAGQFVFSLDNKIIYVSELLTYQILAFDKEGEVLFNFGGRIPENVPVASTSEGDRGNVDNEGQDKFISLMGMGIDGKGNIYASDFGGNGVKVFAPEGKFVMMVPLEKKLQKRAPGRGSGGVAINSRGDIYITDAPNARVQVNDLNGKYKFQITKFKDKSGNELPLLGPTNPRINSFDELYVIDPLVCRVHRFNAKGGYMGSFGYMGDGAGGFNAPCGLAIDKLDRVYVVDRGNGVIQIFSRQGKFLYALCDPSGKRLDIPFPMAINVDSDGLIYISVGGRVGDHPVKVFKYLTKVTK